LLNNQNLTKQNLCLAHDQKMAKPKKGFE